MLKTNSFSEEVHREAEEAQGLGARGVPFFVMNRKYDVSGAPAEAFLQILDQSFTEWKKENPVVEITETIYHDEEMAINCEQNNK